jgi:hypothetical protein
MQCDNDRETKCKVIKLGLVMLLGLNPNRDIVLSC